MKCYLYDHEVGVIDQDTRYCSQCGSKLFQDCPYCGQGVSVYATKCSHSDCGKPFVNCATCYILYRIDQSHCENLRDEINVCGQALVERNGSYHAPLTNVTRSNAIFSDRNSNGTAPPSINCNNSMPISAVVAKHGWLFFGAQTAARTEQGRVRALRLLESEEAWSGSLGRDLPMADASITTYPCYVVSRVNGVVLIDSILDGQQVARIKPSLIDFQEILLGDTLLVFGMNEEGSQRLQKYSLTSPDVPIYDQEVSRTPPQSRYGTLPAATAKQVYFVDLQNRIIQCEVETEPVIAWDNPSQLEVDQIALSGNEIYLLVNDRQTHSLLTLTIDPDGRIGRTTTPRLVELSLRHSQFSVYDGTVIFVLTDETAGIDRLAAYRLARPTEPIWEFRPLANSSVEDYFAVITEKSAYVVYLLRQNQPHTYSVRWVSLNDPLKEGSVQSLSISSNPWISYAQGHILSCDRQRGQIFSKQFPA